MRRDQYGGKDKRKVALRASSDSPFMLNGKFVNFDRLDKDERYEATVYVRESSGKIKPSNRTYSSPDGLTTDLIRQYADRELGDNEVLFIRTYRPGEIKIKEVKVQAGKSTRRRNRRDLVETITDDPTEIGRVRAIAAEGRRKDLASKRTMRDYRAGDN